MNVIIVNQQETTLSSLGIEIIKSLFDSIIVAQPFVVRFAKNMTSFISDAFVIVASLPICIMLEEPAQKMRYDS